MMNIPNLLSLIRVCLAPVFVAVFFGGGDDAHRNAALIYLVASLTDILDGVIARKFGLITKIGRILDPFADKLMTATVLVCSAIEGILPIWADVLFVVKECLMGLGALVMFRRVKDVIPSNFLGKLTTVVFFVVLASLLLFSIPRPFSTVMIGAAVALMFLSLILYALHFYKIVKKANISKGS